MKGLWKMGAESEVLARLDERLWGRPGASPHDLAPLRCAFETVR
jgi:hypothetical protein